jgi:hypothetical protein
MSVPSFVQYSVIAGCVLTIIAVIVGVSQAAKRSNWSESDRRRTVWTTTAVLVGWFVLAVVLALLGVYGAAAGRVPTIELGIVIPILCGGLLIWRSSAVGRLVDAAPRPWVIAVQAYRVEGVIFLILYALNLLPGLFALPAGVGDVAVGLTAAAIGISASGGRQLHPRTVLRWNLLGIADLIVAVATAFLTAPSAFQEFAFDHPSTLITVFPLVLIPTFLVPLAIVLHSVSLVQLARA